jgi:subtilisin family serine protease
VRVYQFRHIRADEQFSPTTIPHLKRGLPALAVLLVALPAAAPARPAPPPSVEVVVTMQAPPLAELHARSLAGLHGRSLDLHTAQSTSYLRRLASSQRSLQARIEQAIPGSSVRWRYSVVLDGMAVVVPRGQTSRLAAIPGVARVWPNLAYHALLDRTPQLIGATQLWGPALATAGQGTKIGIIDDGIDQDHPFFNPSGFSYPPGFPKGNTSFTTPKVIVARAFAPAGTTYSRASLPFDSAESDHATHVAGIAAGNAATAAQGVRVSGIAPRAYLGNYKALSMPTPAFGLDGNAPEIAAAIEAAVRDGMDVINLSLGEPEIEPTRDLVVRAINAAADAGVVPVIAAGNDFSDFGHGSIDSPASAAKAITVAAATGGHGSPQPDRIASFSSAGPTPYSLRMKPDVTAPGVAVLSSVPPREGTWTEFSGTSMASPHVAGAAALLRQRHPTWTVAQIASALTLTGVPVSLNGREVPPTREGGGRIDLVRADNPLVFAAPSSLSFGLLRPGRTAAAQVALTDAGAGAGAWTVTSRLQGTGRGVAVEVPPTVTVPGTLSITARVSAGAGEREVTGFVVLANGGETRRVPLWFHVVRPRLGLDRAIRLTRSGRHRGTTVGAPARVARYRYPDLSPTSAPFPVRLDGPERVYRFLLRRAVANFGVAVTGRAPGVAVQPRIVRDGDENRLAGYTALPFDANPYRSTYGNIRPVVGVVRPAAGAYDVVFDTPRGSRRGVFTFRFWVNDTTPPRVRFLSAGGGFLRVGVSDGGSGVDPRSMRALIDGGGRSVSFFGRAGGVARVSLAGLAAGRHLLVFRAADYQETKNMEDIGPILPNTRVLRKTFVLR